MGVDYWCAGWVRGRVGVFRGVLLLGIDSRVLGCVHKQIQPVNNSQPHPIIISEEIVHDAFDHFSVVGAPHVPDEALGEGI